MFVHWKSLLILGLVFWILLCLNDFFGGKPNYYLEKDFNKFYEDILASADLEKPPTIGNRVFRFGWSLLLWNTMTFAFSLMFCSCARTVSWLLLKIFVYQRTHATQLLNVVEKPKPPARSDSSLSKIPVMVRTGLFNSRSSDTNLKIKPKLDPADASCPNLLSKKSNSNASQVAVKPKCHTIYKNNKLFSPTENENNQLDRHLEKQSVKLREEIAKLKATSLKEHAVLSRRLEAVIGEKKELAKQLTMAQKENRAAKQQLEELLQEKGVLVKRLETATKEFKMNTKTKKFALQKLDEVTANAENLKTQLEQVSRDKEILEGKLKLLETEYEKLQERVIMSNTHNFDSYHEHMAERDTNVVDGDRRKKARRSYGNTEHQENKTETNLASVSQTELDMKNIQVKIKQLERNLENFNVKKTELNFNSGEPGESELSLSIRGNVTDSQMRTDEETDLSDFHVVNSPRLKFWGGKAGDVIQALAHKMNEKVRILDNIKESQCEYDRLESELDDYSSVESEDLRPPERIVSSSRAFQKFLKGLHSCDSRRRSNSYTDLNF